MDSDGEGYGEGDITLSYDENGNGTLYWMTPEGKIESRPLTPGEVWDFQSGAAAWDFAYAVSSDLMNWTVEDWPDEIPG